MGHSHESRGRHVVCAIAEWPPNRDGALARVDLVVAFRRCLSADGFETEILRDDAEIVAAVDVGEQRDAELIEALGAMSERCGSVSVAVGEGANSDSESERSRLQALQTLGLLARLPTLGPVLSWRSAVPDLIMTATPGAHELLVETVLGSIIGDPQRDRMLETLVAVLACRQVSAAAGRLHMHRQTLYERLALIQKLTGFSLDSPEDRLCYVFALRAMRLWTALSATKDTRQT